MNDTRSHGFTLVELMVTVIILSIIVGIAYPAYTKFTTQTRRSDAQVALTQSTNRLEKYFSTCNQYPSAAGPLAITNDWPGTGTATACPPGDDGTQGIGQLDDESPERHYTLSVDTTAATCAPAVAGACFVVTATPKAGGLQMGNGALRIDSTGLKDWDKNDDATWCCKWSDK